MRATRWAWRNLSRAVYAAAVRIPYFHFVRNTASAQAPCTFSLWFFQKILGFNRAAYWPVHFTSKIVQHKSILVGVNTNPGIEPGCYIQGIGGIRIGDNTQIAANVGIISANHDVYDNNAHRAAEVTIGSHCWVGMGAVILPGVALGDFTIVGAGSIVTKSFPDGYCVIGGNPAKQIRTLDPALCVPGDTASGYVGYMRRPDFDRYRESNLWL